MHGQGKDAPKKKKGKDKDKDAVEPPKVPEPEPVKPAGTQRRARGKQAAVPPNATPTPTPPKEKAAAEKLEASLNSAQKALDQMMELNATVLWKGIVRSNDLDRRMGKANSAERDMQRLGANDRATDAQRARAVEIMNKIVSRADAVASLKQVFIAVRTNEALDVEIANGTELVANIGKCAQLLLVDDVATTMEMVHHIAKKLADAPWQYSRVEPSWKKVTSWTLTT